MSTRYVLVGGYPQKAADGGRAFCQEVVDGFDQPIRVLVCLFARLPETWVAVFRETEAFFSNCLPDVQVEYQQADQKIFLEQVKWANVIYLRGGITSLLLKQLRQIKGWEKLLEGKTVVGSSAGADVLSVCSYNLDDLKLEEGLGLVPVKVLVHYRSNYNAPNIDWDHTLTELENFKENLPILTLAEGQFEVIKH